MTVLKYLFEVKKKKCVRTGVSGENNGIVGITWIREQEASSCSSDFPKVMTWWLAEAPADRQHRSASWWREPPLLEHQGQEGRDSFCCYPAELLVWTTGSSLLRNTSVEKSDIRTQQGVIYNIQDKSHNRLRFGARRQGQSWPVTSHWDEYHQGSALSFPYKRPLKVPLKGPVTLRLSRLPIRNNRIIPCKDGWGRGATGLAESY